MRISRIILLFSIGVLLAQTLYYYPNLPEIMASHFDGAGKPNGWMSKQAFFLLEFVILAIVVGNSIFLPTIIGFLPDRLINIPNRDYWLAPERRFASFQRLSHHFGWFGVILLGPFVAVNQTVINANLSSQNLSSAVFWAILGAFFIGLIVWAITLHKTFRVPAR